MAKGNETAERAARLLEALRKQGETNGEPVLTVARLKELADPGATDEEVLQALAKKPFAQQVVLADKKALASPIALAEGSAALAASGQLLDYALGRLCAADAPLHGPAKIVGQVDKALRPAFQEALDKRIANNDWPEHVGTQLVKNKVLLYLKQFPPPPPPLPRKSAHAELSEKLLRALELQKSAGGSAYPVPLSRLLEQAAPDSKPALVKRALAEPPFLGEAVLGLPGQADGPVALGADREALASSPVLLDAALGVAKKQPVALDKLAEVVAEGLRLSFTDTVRRQAEAGGLPASVGSRTHGGQLELYRKDRLLPEEMLREKVLARLHQLRRGDRYPIALDELLGEVAPETSPELRTKALNEKELKAQLVVVAPDQPNAPVVLKGDEERAANSPDVLHYAVGLLSTAERPLWPVAKVAGKLHKALRAPFTVAVETLVRENKLPASVAVAEVGGKPHLRLSKHELPRPPAEVLANKLLAALRRGHGQDDYPTLLDALLRHAGSEDAKVIKGALALPAFKAETVVVPLPGGGSLVGLASDRERIVGGPRLLEEALKAVRTDDNQGVRVGDLKKKIAKDVQNEFGEGIDKRLATGELPKTVGSLRIKGQVYLFLVADVGTLPAPRPEAPTRTTAEERPAEKEKVDFARLFETAFARLDKEKGSHNLVSLVKLRQEVPVDRDTFDHELHRLRKAGRYSLTGAEGRHGISHEEREAGIAEEGALLLFVSRKEG